MQAIQISTMRSISFFKVILLYLVVVSPDYVHAKAISLDMTKIGFKLVKQKSNNKLIHAFPVSITKIIPDYNFMPVNYKCDSPNDRGECLLSGFGDWLNKQMDKILYPNQEQPVQRYQEPTQSQFSDLEGEKVNLERTTAKNKAACENEYRAMISNGIYGSRYIIQDGKVWSISNYPCTSHINATKPEYVYKGELERISKDNCGSLTQYKLKGSKLCLFSKDYGQGDISEYCYNRD
jgi:hypothetical protein